ncbi:MAG TPA: bifunctional diaminohydroxyphosphoribosylaminopyrimidine deaminase/5-amino-6-(5-phosphoribosylamino)uracil reductase RibD [Anaeromyxobacteraceae bacterium]|nr:bifunctional diaminohydroxyphosphoribosylaminopyrimidine deaminase/5-amino-6-(5-phosphoribosylamino)uracil reductase RibD [Anaeromyxobacteraceae bacterium]
MNRRPSAAERMALALREARRGLGRTSPNPAVGAVLVKGGKVVARGHHARAGSPHAEVVALRRAGARARGADLYTTLEPCDHWGRTPPCSVAIIEAGVRRVFVGSSDPNPLVNGRGLRRLRRAGVGVVTGVLRAECDRLNEAWFRFIVSGRPHVTLKAAVTLDGKIATRTGDSRWVTGTAARALVHRLRDRADAVLVGAGTALADDPRLSARLPGRAGRNPLRVVLDSRLGLPRTLRLFRRGSGGDTLVAYVTGRPPGAPRGVEYVRFRGRAGKVDLGDLLRELARRNVTSLLVEGGGEVHRAFLAAGLVDRVLLFVAPKVVGGDGIPWVGTPGVLRMADALALEDVDVRRVGGDILVSGRPAGSLASPRGRG